VHLAASRRLDLTGFVMADIDQGEPLNVATLKEANERVRGSSTTQQHAF
jgi:hypothetical protein